MFVLSRYQLCEFGDQPWLHAAVRASYHDCLGVVTRLCGFYKKMYVPFLQWAKMSRAHEVLDVASGRGGPVRRMIERAMGKGKSLPRVILSDLYPHSDVYAQLRGAFGAEKIGFLRSPLDADDAATQPIKAISFFSVFHHFAPHKAEKILNRSLRAGKSVFIAEPFERRVSMAVLTCVCGFFIGLLTPILQKPFSFRNLFFCTLFPIVPLMVQCDGLVSVLRIYSSDELREMIPHAERGRYRIRSGHTTTLWIVRSPFFFVVPRDIREG